jgi:hypothetical protein
MVAAFRLSIMSRYKEATALPAADVALLPKAATTTRGTDR